MSLTAPLFTLLLLLVCRQVTASPSPDCSRIGWDILQRCESLDHPHNWKCMCTDFYPRAFPVYVECAPEGDDDMVTAWVLDAMTQKFIQACESHT
ncbi:hypothetical protein HK104_003883 [Borealophlyctis nickersoniae]|nr:hypothetical protein HK104_003883 [Borealophlyctis nickersoniae]